MKGSNDFSRSISGSGFGNLSSVLLAVCSPTGTPPLLSKQILFGGVGFGSRLNFKK